WADRPGLRTAHGRDGRTARRRIQAVAPGARYVCTAESSEGCRRSAGGPPRRGDRPGIECDRGRGSATTADNGGAGETEAGFSRKGRNSDRRQLMRPDGRSGGGSADAWRGRTSGRPQTAGLSASVQLYRLRPGANGTWTGFCHEQTAGADGTVAARL